ncbi:MAG: CCA tRNA nucleotidyltransferase, partial [Victivallaceae bacterium]|nr:CCA tRNA nucleotidyltransferase [Victivallaceae bacterium]
MKISNQYFNCFPIFSVAKSVVTQLKDAGFKAFFVGGAVRDMLLGKPPKDIDIATNATPEQTVALFKRCHQVGVSFGVIVVTVKDFNFEIATFREEREYADGRHPQIITYTGDPYLDAARRDFTINAMFYDPDTTEILDFFNGRADLENGILRCVGDSMTRFNEDHLRMLRAVRFATRFNFRIDPQMCDAVIQLKDKITKISAERIRDELNAMLTGPRPSTAIRMLE